MRLFFASTSSYNHGVILQPEAFFRERVDAIVAGETIRLGRLLPNAIVEHVGGTSIIGALTKGDVDLCAHVDSADFAAAVHLLQSIYVINQPENWTTTFASFKDDTSFELPLGVQLSVKDDDPYLFIALRNHLRTDPKALARYNAVKRAHESSDDAAYREAKGALIELLLSEMRQRSPATP